jgi:hypothetical protein
MPSTIALCLSSRKIAAASSLSGAPACAAESAAITHAATIAAVRQYFEAMRD